MYVHTYVSPSQKYGENLDIKSQWKEFAMHCRKKI